MSTPPSQDGPRRSEDVRTPLSQLGVGQHARICSARVDADDAAYLSALGLGQSARVVVRRRGEPCIVALCGERDGGCRIGLARRLADRILVEPKA